jgi:hypothetical protein
MRALLLGLGVVVLSGCGSGGSARYIVRDMNGGVVAIPCDTAKNRAKAHDLMTAACPKGYTIIREEEVVTGQVTTDNMRDDTASRDVDAKKKNPITLTTDIKTRTVTTSDTKEIRIVYQANP